MSELEWVRSDAIRLLGLPVNRWRGLARYGDTSDHTYSNGTEAEIANDTAYEILNLGPALRKVIEAGVVALRPDKQFDAYLVALYSGDHDKLIRLERLFEAGFPADPEPPADAMTPEQVADVMIGELHERYGVEADK